jgi:hypothetical protein
VSTGNWVLKIEGAEAMEAVKPVPAEKNKAVRWFDWPSAVSTPSAVPTASVQEVDSDHLAKEMEGLALSCAAFRFNVGGVRLDTKMSTALRLPRVANLIKGDRTARHLNFDRDSQTFIQLLDLVRDGKRIPPGLSTTKVFQLREEARYFGCHELEAQLSCNFEFTRAHTAKRVGGVEASTEYISYAKALKKKGLMDLAVRKYLKGRTFDPTYGLRYGRSGTAAQDDEFFADYFSLETSRECRARLNDIFLKLLVSRSDMCNCNLYYDWIKRLIFENQVNDPMLPAMCKLVSNTMLIEVDWYCKKGLHPMSAMELIKPIAEQVGRAWGESFDEINFINELTEKGIVSRICLDSFRLCMDLKGLK